MAYALGINLAHLIGASVECDIIDGVPQKFLRIPVEKNFMQDDGNGNIYLRILMLKAAPDKSGASFNLILQVPVEMLRERKRLLEEERLTGEKKQIPIRKSYGLGRAWAVNAEKYQSKSKGNIDAVLNR